MRVLKVRQSNISDNMMRIIITYLSNFTVNCAAPSFITKTQFESFSYIQAFSGETTTTL